MDQIASLSKRLEPKLTCKVELNPDLPRRASYYWRQVRVVKSDLLAAMSPATFTRDFVDPALEAIATLLNEHSHVVAGKLPLPPEGDGVIGWVSADGSLPIRMLMCPKDDAYTVIVFDILVKTT